MDTLRRHVHRLESQLSLPSCPADSSSLHKSFLFLSETIEYQRQLLKQVTIPSIIPFVGDVSLDFPSHLVSFFPPTVSRPNILVIGIGTVPSSNGGNDPLFPPSGLFAAARGLSQARDADRAIAM